jgi:ankyrin repeat protein
MDFSKGIKINDSDDNIINSQVLLNEIKLDIRPERILELISHPAVNINVQNLYGQTPLMIALEKEFINMDIIHLLLRRKRIINVDIQDINGETALFYIVKNKYIDVKTKEKIIKLLFSHNADKNIRNYKGKKAIDYANYAKDLNTQILINNFRYKTPPSLLHLSIKKFKEMTREKEKQSRFFIPGFEPLPQKKDKKQEFLEGVIKEIIERNETPEPSPPRQSTHHITTSKGGKRGKKSNKKTRKVRKR